MGGRTVERHHNNPATRAVPGDGRLPIKNAVKEEPRRRKTLLYIPRFYPGDWILGRGDSRARSCTFMFRETAKFWKRF
jgi:hypothetical protein